MTQDELNQIQAELKTRISGTKAVISKCQEGLKLDRDKLAWIEGASRHGDVVEMLVHRGFNKEPTVKRVVVLEIDRHGSWRSCAPIKRDGRLSRNRHAAERDLVPVGRYDADDLPEPDEAAQFGLDHPVPR